MEILIPFRNKNIGAFFGAEFCFFSVHFSVHFCLFFCRENALFNSGKHCTLYYKVRKIQFFEFYYACNNRLFRRLILSKKSYCCKHRFCIPYGTQNLLVREKSLRPLKQKMRNLVRATFVSHRTKKPQFFVQKKQRKIYLHCSDYVCRTPLLATRG